MSSRSLHDVRLGGVASQGMHSPTSNLPDSARGPPLPDLRAAGCIDCCRKRGHGPRRWLPTAAPICTCLPRDTCFEMSDHCIGSSVTDVVQQRTPVSASQTHHSSLGRRARSSLSLRLVEYGSPDTHLVNLGLQLCPRTTDQPAEPAHSLCERPVSPCAVALRPFNQFRGQA